MQLRPLPKNTNTGEIDYEDWPPKRPLGISVESFPVWSSREGAHNPPEPHMPPPACKLPKLEPDQWPAESDFLKPVVGCDQTLELLTRPPCEGEFSSKKCATSASFANSAAMVELPKGQVLSDFWALMASSVVE